MGRVRFDARTETLSTNAAQQYIILLGRGVTLRAVEVGTTSGPCHVVITLQLRGGIALNLDAGWVRTGGSIVPAPALNLWWVGKMPTDLEDDNSLNISVRNDSGSDATVIMEYIYET